jgi:hypothetical protein
VRSANLLADFWYTAWIDAGCPNLNKGLLTSAKQKERDELQEEMEAFKKNRLIEKKMLIAKQGSDREE